MTYLVVPPSSTRNLSSSARVIPVPLVASSTCIAAPDTLSAVVMVASLESAMAAEALISALTITPEPIAAVPFAPIERSPDITTGL